MYDAISFHDLRTSELRVSLPIPPQFAEAVQHSTGGINPFLGLGTLRRIPFPVFDDDVQRKLGEEVRTLVESAHDNEDAAYAAIESAKKRVELAVETAADRSRVHAP